MPFANASPSGPTSSTASPASKPPSQETTPTPRRLRRPRPAPGERRRRRHAAAHGLAEAEPELERRLAALGSGEAGAARLAGEDRPEDGLALPASDDRRDPAAAASSAARPCSASRRGRAGSSPRAGLRARVPSEISSAPGAGRARVDALDLGQQHEQPRAEQHGDLRGERVVVAEGDLVGGGRVVLVHDRHDAELEQRVERVAGIDVGRAVAEVGGGEQDLRRGTSGASASSHARLEPRLPESRRRLELAATLRGRRSSPSRGSPSAIAPEETTQTGSPPATIRAISRAARAQQRRRTARRARDQRRAELDDDGHRCCVPSPTTRYWRSQRSR